MSPTMFVLNSQIPDIYERISKRHLTFPISIMDHYEWDEKKRGKIKMSRRLPNDPYFLFKDTMQLTCLETNSYVLYIKCLHPVSYLLFLFKVRDARMLLILVFIKDMRQIKFQTPGM